MKFYIDTNIFIYAATDNGELGKGARAIIKMLEAGIFSGATSTITLSEIMYNIKKRMGKEASINVGQALLRMNNLLVADFDKSIAHASVYTASEHNLPPQDAIHFATMGGLGIREIITEDKDFGNVKGIKRRSIRDIVEKFA